jgi:hypothetical protein
MYKGVWKSTDPQASLSFFITQLHMSLEQNLNFIQYFYTITSQHYQLCGPHTSANYQALSWIHHNKITCLVVRTMSSLLLWLQHLTRSYFCSDVPSPCKEKTVTWNQAWTIWYVVHGSKTVTCLCDISLTWFQLTLSVTFPGLLLNHTPPFPQCNLIQLQQLLSLTTMLCSFIISSMQFKVCH